VQGAGSPSVFCGDDRPGFDKRMCDLFSIPSRSSMQWCVTSNQIVIDFIEAEIGRCFARGADSKALSRKERRSSE
jgi:hypothetical protein